MPETLEDDLAWRDGDDDSEGGALIPGRKGRGVWLRALLEMAGLSRHATHITLHATDGSFLASVPLAVVIDRAVVVYRLGDAPLPQAQGESMCLYITDVEECTVEEVDACANVRFLGVIQLTAGPGVDTRPTTTQEHTVLHEREGHEHLQ